MIHYLEEVYVSEVGKIIENNNVFDGVCSVCVRKGDLDILLMIGKVKEGLSCTFEEQSLIGRHSVKPRLCVLDLYIFVSFGDHFYVIVFILL